MAILRVAQMGNPVLRQVAERVTEEDLDGDEIQQLIDDMLDTVDDYEGAGLAAPQVHESVRIVVICPPAEGEEEEARAPLVLVNPSVSPDGEDRQTDWEGCLSIPGLRGQVPRHTSAVVTALNRDGKPIRFTARDYAARILQHEVDHLDGVLYLDRMPSMQSLCCLEEYRRMTDESA